MGFKYTSLIQKEMGEGFQNQIGSGTFPQSTLFYGSDNSSKMLSALEVILELSKLNKIENLLQDVIFLSNRNHLLDFRAKAISFINEPTEEKKELLFWELCTIYFQLNGMSAEKSVKKSKKRDSSEVDFAFYIDEFIKGDIQYLVKIIPGMFLYIKNVYDVKSISVDHIRRAIEWAGETGGQSGKKFLIIDEVDSLGSQSANCMLKTLEEPPFAFYMILLAKDIKKVLSTIKSRCRLYSFVNSSSKEIAKIYNATSMEEFLYENGFPNYRDIYDFSYLLSSLRFNSNRAFQKNNGIIFKIINATSQMEDDQFYWEVKPINVWNVCKLAILKGISDGIVNNNLSVSQAQKASKLILKITYMVKVFSMSLKQALLMYLYT